jgi:SNF2 family DNA or RNA helicase
MTKPFIPDTPQVIAHAHLMRCPHALLFVGMGIGKTASCLSALRTLFCELEAEGALVVAPNRVANLTWPEEVRDWDEFKWMKVANLRTPAGKAAFLDGKADIYTINYESLHVVSNLVAARGGTLPYDVCIWDELTKAKNPSAKRINRFRTKVPRPPRVWGLTGTPMPNSELDLFAQVRLIDDGVRLGKTFMLYRETYFSKADYMGYKWEVREGARNTIEERISDITLTLRSKDWVDIPDPIVEDVEIPMDEDLTEQYREFEKTLILQLKEGGEITAATAAALVTKLLQFTSGASYDEFKDVHVIHTLKVDALRRLVAKTDGPVLVAVNFQHEQDRLRKAFPQAEFFRDAATATQQAALKDRWNAGKVPVLVAHPKSVGHGLNLQHGGSTLVWTTLTYSREDYEQMICRLARRGQTKQVRVYRLIIPGTVDEVVASVVESKADNEAKLLNALTMLEALRNGG